jgi:hypothetical protein
VGGVVTGYRPASDPQWDYLVALVADRALPELGACAEERLERLAALREQRQLDVVRASTLITQLRDAPLDLTQLPVPPGVYRRDDQVYVVQLNRARTNVYTKQLVQIGGRRLRDADEEVVKADFVYAPEALAQLTTADQLTLEQAREYLVRYTHCMICGRPLKDATSVANSIGPVCVKMFAPAREPDPEPDPAVTDLLARLLAQASGA